MCVLERTRERGAVFQRRGGDKQARFFHSKPDEKRGTQVSTQKTISSFMPPSRPLVHAEHLRTDHDQVTPATTTT